MHAQFTLSQLNPLGKQLILLVDIVCQFTNVIQTFGIVTMLRDLLHLMTDAVDEGQNAHGH